MGEQTTTDQQGLATWRSVRSIVLSGLWHSADVAELAQAIFIALDEATEHRPRKDTEAVIHD
ncbi:hypothetical protein [Microbulbifer epialgicus]|uniref:Uncharacterized protein n=1 Tax=Microbulbifer epialgicus TaxID=393907 RepID=A0ABV4P455_9GAMM